MGLGPERNKNGIGTVDLDFTFLDITGMYVVANLFSNGECQGECWQKRENTTNTDYKF